MFIFLNHRSGGEQTVEDQKKKKGNGNKKKLKALLSVCLFFFYSIIVQHNRQVHTIAEQTHNAPLFDKANAKTISSSQGVL